MQRGLTREVIPANADQLTAMMELTVAETLLLLWGKNDDGQLGTRHSSSASLSVGPSPFKRPSARGHGRSFDDSAEKMPSNFRPALEASAPGPRFMKRITTQGSVTSFTSSPTLCQVLSGTRVLQVSCGSRHTMAVVEGGKAYSWGWGACGQLGHGDDHSTGTPRLVEALSDGEGGRPPQPVTYVSAGGIHSAAIVACGCVYTWGSSSYGQLGLGPDVTARGMQAVPAKVMLSETESPRGSRRVVGSAGLTRPSSKRQEEMVMAMIKARKTELRAKIVSCGGMHTAALTSEGIVYCWGRADSGQLGIGAEWVHETTSGVMGVEWPRRVAGLLENRHTVSVNCGGFHTAAVTKEGECFTWGKEDFGMLGCSNEALLKGGLFLPHPVTLRNPGDTSAIVEESTEHEHKAVSVACGGWHTAVIGHKGGVWTCGRGEYGRLGLGDEMSQWHLTPVDLDNARATDTVGDGTNELDGSSRAGLALNGAVPKIGESPDSPTRFSEASTLSPPPTPPPPTPPPPPLTPSAAQPPTASERGGADRAEDPATMVSLGGSHSLVLTSSGKVFGFGRQEHGRLGMEADMEPCEPMPLPIEITSLQREGWAVQTISAGGVHSAAILTRRSD